MDSDNYFTRIAVAFIRGKTAVVLPNDYRAKPLNDLTALELEEILTLGRQADLRLHKFKRTMGLRRVNRVLGALKGIAPSDLLDIGSGRGAFLWPLLDCFPELPVTCIDQQERRVDDLLAIRDGGIERLSAQVMDATLMTFADRAFDVVTFLEVLEHIADAQAALREAMRVASRFVIVSVPSKEDNNPEHIHLFNQETLEILFKDAGASSITFDHVLNHLIAVARVTS